MRKSEARLALEQHTLDIIERYITGGETIYDIADSYEGASYSMVWAVLLEAGVATQGARGAQRDVPVEVGAPLSRAFRPRVFIPPVHGDLVTLAQVREMAGLDQEELASAIGVSYPRASQIEKTPVDRLKLPTIARQVEGCGAHLKVIAEFGDDDAVVLYDSTGVDYSEGGEWSPVVSGAARAAPDGEQLRSRGDG